jgi:glycosyltransferase involved in cell wall biosynthesis
MQLVTDKPLILAPRGEFSLGALRLKSIKKRLYLCVAKAFGLYRGVIWQASSEHEETDIRRRFGRDVPVAVAPDLPSMVHSVDGLLPKNEKSEGCLKIVFLSRISRMKNLNSALEMLEGLKGKVKFSIYGPIEDKAYWAECEKIIYCLASNIEVRYYGSVAHDKVGTVLSEHDLFFLPTLGENFGHVILEALCAGCPVLISDQTPWRDLENKGVGWDLSLSKLEQFQVVLQRCIDMNDEEYMKWSKKAREYCREVTEDEGVVEQNRKLFSGLIEEN